MDEINSVLQNYFDSVEKTEKIKTGNDNENYFVWADGQRYVLRIYNEVQYKPRTQEDIEEEISFINFFSSHGVQTPAVIAARDGKLISKIGERFCAVFEFYPGNYAYGRLKSIHFAQIGEMMGKVHRLTEDNNIDTVKLYQGKYLWQLIEQTEQDAKVFESVPQHFIHNDYHFANILFDEDKLSALLDFDCYCVGHFACDIARFFVADLAYTEVEDYWHTQEFVDAFYGAYAKSRKLNEGDEKLIPLYINLHQQIQINRLNKNKDPRVSRFIGDVEKLRALIG